MFLNADELIAMTGKEKSQAQCRALNALGVPHKRRPDGKVLVLRSVAESALGAGQRKITTIEPDWGAVA